MTIFADDVSDPAVEVWQNLGHVALILSML